MLLAVILNGFPFEHRTSQEPRFDLISQRIIRITTAARRRRQPKTGASGDRRQHSSSSFFWPFRPGPIKSRQKKKQLLQNQINASSSIQFRIAICRFDPPSPSPRWFSGRVYKRPFATRHDGRSVEPLMVVKHGIPGRAPVRLSHRAKKGAEGFPFFMAAKVMREFIKNLCC